MKTVRVSLKFAAAVAGLSMALGAGEANATTLNVTATSVVYPSAPAVTASIHLNSPAASYSSVYVSPQYLTGTLDGKAVQLFAYCVDILNTSGPGLFDVVPLIDYLNGNAAKYNQMAALIAAAGGPANRYSDGAAQAAVWEAIYDNTPYNAASGNFWIDNVHNDPTLVADANALLAQAVANAGSTGTNLQLFVAKNSSRQDMLFWTVAPVPEPSTWAMMLLGFGFIGGAMRSRRRAEKLQASPA